MIGAIVLTMHRTTKSTVVEAGEREARATADWRREAAADDSPADGRRRPSIVERGRERASSENEGGVRESEGASISVARARASD
ncbi:hypothetical protein Ccrd_013008 [Cynara cardunculus var. scolymus]|uniref:Uncharacterized protein n=1 Tax=Cynara cardunculus var. scolymus TaxID=59895 RepID=A0A118K565_CYNCS|nr:hypothetical protein Ccrd_013008 [Cynara cardunculus var. scolymus]